MPAAPCRYLIVVYRPLPAAPHVVCFMLEVSRDAVAAGEEQLVRYAA
jgi:hypothetical protein